MKQTSGVSDIPPVGKEELNELRRPDSVIQSRADSLPAACLKPQPASPPPRVHSHHTAEIYTQHSAPAGAAGQRTEPMSPRSCKHTRSGGRLSSSPQQITSAALGPLAGGPPVTLVDRTEAEGTHTRAGKRICVCTCIYPLIDIFTRAAIICQHK